MEKVYEIDSTHRLFLETSTVEKEVRDWEYVKEENKHKWVTHKEYYPVINCYLIKPNEEAYKKFMCFDWEKPYLPSDAFVVKNVFPMAMQYYTI